MTTFASYKSCFFFHLFVSLRLMFSFSLCCADKLNLYLLFGLCFQEVCKINTEFRLYDQHKKTHSPNADVWLLRG